MAFRTIGKAVTLQARGLFVAQHCCTTLAFQINSPMRVQRQFTGEEAHQAEGCTLHHMEETIVKKSAVLILKCSLAAVSIAAIGIIGVKAASIEVKGFKRTPIAEQVIDGPLTERNGKYKMTVAAFAFEPGGYVGPHLHAGPGFRCVTSGEVTNIEADGKTTVYGAGQCYWESGLKSHTPRNNGDKPATGIVVELLPASLTGSSLMPVPAGQ
jgi:quercetin dioxygenase-like cupin family protein